MSVPVAWMSRVELYLAYRRRHGFKLTIDETRLRSFARFADELGTEVHLTVALAAAWAQATQRPSHFTWARRIEVLRGFARFCLRSDPTTGIPPRGLFGPAHQRLVPHIYTEAELGALLEADNGCIHQNVVCDRPLAGASSDCWPHAGCASPKRSR